MIDQRRYTNVNRNMQILKWIGFVGLNINEIIRILFSIYSCQFISCQRHLNRQIYCILIDEVKFSAIFYSDG